MALTNILKSVEMSAQSTTEVEGQDKVVLYMTGRKSTNSDPTFNYTIKDKDLYDDPAVKKQAKKDFSDFCDMVEEA